MTIIVILYTMWGLSIKKKGRVAAANSAADIKGMSIEHGPSNKNS